MAEIENVVIIGSGPAGWTAAIYAARADLRPLVCIGVPKSSPAIVLPGGQLMLTTEVENYPGFPDGITGPDMMADFQKQAERFGTRIRGNDIVSCDFSEKPFKLETNKGETILAKAVIIATGATANWMGLENEMRLARSGGGVSACAVCDGALPAFRDQPLAVVGGGDSALEEASYLTKFASKVYVIHRRDEFRASKAMQKRIFASANAEPLWNKVVVDVLGDDVITGVLLKDTVTGEESTLDLRGLFVAIGHTPTTEFLDGTGIELDDAKYIQLKTRSSKTNIPGVFAAGDVADSVYRQAVSAAGMGCIAALDAEHYLSALSD
ncbi:MAG TPA: thioredoxin-disulfide reductase [Phycisphaerales bacterium]|nr:thioredoxin-disulfide reductase [Phycisphaerales bacterium]HIB01749.1 thioredoxin-disulfide reductase [Phycisphaerales bacterium]HIN84691.1 thioredoxin-disulfide reductase [Phycisphaerales bacterium]HIO52257.1 thioredoxin-disulfide reductase [Phycisphaerales bacterium]